MAGESERINSDVWRSTEVLDIFARRDGLIDEGEALLVRRIAEEAERRPILDIGVGGGRTIAYLRGATDEYVAVDYLEEMVGLARSRHPDVRIEQGDARDLSMFADDSFGVVFFSYNGIDGISHEDRRQVHASVRRVLRPGGIFAYSTHNLGYCAAGRPPWARCQWDVDNGPGAMVAFARRLSSRSRSYRRLRNLTVRGDGWALLVGSGYDFSVLWHHVSFEEARRELDEAGYAPDIEVFDASGARVQAGQDTSSSPWFYLIAREPGQDGGWVK
jgi:SAM-dependent methyltransferase